MRNKDVRLLNIALGVWIFISAFLWPHRGPQFVNTWLMGIIVIVSATIAIKVPVFRFVSTAAGIWLVTSMFAWPRLEAPTVWNNAIVGAAIALVSVIGPRQVEEFGP